MEDPCFEEEVQAQRRVTLACLISKASSLVGSFNNIKKRQHNLMEMLPKPSPATSWVQKHGHVIVHAGLVQLIHQPQRCTSMRKALEHWVADMGELRVPPESTGLDPMQGMIILPNNLLLFVFLGSG